MLAKVKRLHCTTLKREEEDEEEEEEEEEGEEENLDQLWGTVCKFII